MDFFGGSMSVIKIIFIIVIPTMGVFFACGNSGDKTNPGSSSAGDAANLSTGFANNCASCHGAAGGGGTERSIQGYSGSLSAFISLVRGGRGRMPATSSSAYSEIDLNADYTYLQSL